jgi:hypothetical protein
MSSPVIEGNTFLKSINTFNHSPKSYLILFFGLSAKSKIKNNDSAIFAWHAIASRRGVASGGARVATVGVSALK